MAFSMVIGAADSAPRVVKVKGGTYPVYVRECTYAGDDAPGAKTFLCINDEKLQAFGARILDEKRVKAFKLGAPEGPWRIWTY